ncbi:MAG: hypothetical protein APF84_11215 [Gracilibacter sp. BRH_c7a]|nr:MAG: hypothetical protein APF84_11215 [Gracilibacter sp. BRH_c7a]
MFKKNKLITVIIIISMLILTACSSPATRNQPAEPQQAAEKELTKFVIGMAVTPPNLVHVVPYMAKDLGYFEEEGLDVELLEFEGGLQSIRGSISGGVDMGWTSVDSVILARNAGDQDIMVYYSAAPRLDVSMVANESIKTLDELAGKNIGVSGEVGGFADLMNTLVFEKTTVPYKDQTTITTSMAGRVQALVTGTADTGVLHIDQVAAVKAQREDIHILANLWDVAPEWWFSAMVANKNEVEKNKQAYEGAIRALIKATRYMYDNPEETIKMSAGFTGVAEDTIRESYDLLTDGKVWAVNTGLSTKMYESTAAKMVDIGKLEEGKTPSYNQVIDSSLADKIVNELGAVEGEGLL